MAGFQDSTQAYLIRTNLWSRQIKELLLDELNAMKFVRVLSDFPDGYTLDNSTGACIITKHFAICWNTLKLLILIRNNLEDTDLSTGGQSAGKEIKMNEKDLSWLGGIWDGEGSIALFSAKEADGSKKIRPVINVVNTDIMIINEIQRILLEMGCNFHFKEQKPISPRHKLQWRMACSNMKTLQTFLKIMIPYFKSVKKAKGEILLRYVEQRMNKIETRNGNGTTPYDKDDWSYIEQFRSSETTREAA